MRTLARDRLPCAVLAIALLAAPARGAALHSLLLSYEVWMGGVQVLSFDARLALGANGYTAQVTARTDGVVAWLYPYTLDIEAVGSSGGERRQPQRFFAESRSDTKHRLRRIIYLRDGSLEVWLGPPKQRGRRDKLPADVIEGTLDPVSAMISVLDSLARDGRCAGSIPVFDGKRRYDIGAHHLGPGAISASRYTSFSGSATRCRLAIQRLAGFSKKSKRSGRMPSTIELWLAPVADVDWPVPVRMEGESTLGSIVAHLVAARRGPVGHRAER